MRSFIIYRGIRRDHQSGCGPPRAQRLAICAMAALAMGLFAGEASSDSLTTQTPPNNTSGGVYMSLTDTTDAGFGLSVYQIDVGGFSGEIGTNVDVEVYTRLGGYTGFETVSSAWDLHDTLTVQRAGTTTAVALDLTTPIAIDDGQVVSIYLQALASGGIRYFGTDPSPPQMLYSNDDLELFSDTATTATTAFGGSLFSPRSFSGTIWYDVTGDPGDPPVIPLPAAVWGGMVLMGVMGGRRLVRRRRGD